MSVYFYENYIEKVKILCSIDQNCAKTEITCVKNFSPPAQGGEIEFQWTDLTLKNFEEIHGLSRILLLLADKCATALDINREYFQSADSSGDFLIQLVKKLILYYRSENLLHNCPSFYKSFSILLEKLDLVSDCLTWWRSETELLLTIQNLLWHCEHLFLGVLFYLHFAHSQLLLISRNTSIPDSNFLLSFETAKIEIENIFYTKKMSQEFFNLHQ
jgi:hypothetical protein